MFKILQIIAVLATCLFAKTTTEGISEDGVKVINKVRQQNSRYGGRGLSQIIEENFKISTEQCNPQLQDCTGTCDDEVPLGAPFDCQTYSSLKLCSTLQPELCRISCGKCEQEQECVDVPVAGADCSAVVNSGSCNAESIKGIFCAKSCGTCGNQTTDNKDSNLKQFVEPTAEPSPLTSAVQGNCEVAEALECDVAALLAFKGNLIAGEDLLSDWVGSDPCVWSYITCLGGTSNKRVTKIEMDFYQTNKANVLSGSITPEFSNLRFVETINLDSSQMQGSLYKEFSVLTSLTEFQMVRLGLTGSLPPEYSTLSLLEIFRVSFNTLTGIIPPDWTTWSNLLDIILAENRLSGTLLPEYSIFSKLDTFDVGDNFISGQIPVQYSNWKECITFTIARNSFTGLLPVQFSVMKKMDYLFATDNRLTGTLPENFSEWVSCETFWVGDNRISGTLPVEYSKMQRMKEFGVENNRMSGGLPVEYSRMRKLQEFFSTGNSISSVIPNEWSQLERFAEILV